MAGVDVGDGGGKRRASNSEVNMIPFIDLLMVTIAFLLITAVWTTSSRIDASAQVPGQEPCTGDCDPKVERTLHVHDTPTEFTLVWKQAATVIHETRVPKDAVEVGYGDAAQVRFPALAKAIEREWQSQGVHVDAGDRRVDQAILHTDDRTPFREIVGVLDAVYATRRDRAVEGGAVARIPAFNMVFASR